MTRSGHNVVMKEVRIAELKAHLSEYLRLAQRGEHLIVLDRDTPIAAIVPTRPRTRLQVRKPAHGAPPLNQVPLPGPLKLKVDIVDLLLEERQGHR